MNKELRTRQEQSLAQDTLNNVNGEGGFLLMDALVAIVLAAIVALGLTQSTLIAYRYTQQSHNRGIAKELAVERLEELATIDPETFINGDQVVENNISRGGSTFTRTTDYVIETDRTRLVTVTVSADRSKIPVSVALERGFSLWGER